MAKIPLAKINVNIFPINLIRWENKSGSADVSDLQAYSENNTVFDDFGGFYIDGSKCMHYFKVINCMRKNDEMIGWKMRSTKDSGITLTLWND